MVGDSRWSDSLRDVLSAPSIVGGASVIASASCFRIVRCVCDGACRRKEQSLVSEPYRALSTHVGMVGRRELGTTIRAWSRHKL